MRKSDVEEWLVQAVMALCSRANTVVRTCDGDSRTFEGKVAQHRVSVHCDVAMKEMINRLPSWHLLYAADHVLMATTREDTRK